MSRDAGSDDTGGFDEFLSNWRFLCKLHRGLNGNDDFDEFLSNSSEQSSLAGNESQMLILSVDAFYSNYITRDEPNMLAKLTILAVFMQITS